MNVRVTSYPCLRAILSNAPWPAVLSRAPTVSPTPGQTIVGYQIVEPAGGCNCDLKLEVGLNLHLCPSRSSLRDGRFLASTAPPLPSTHIGRARVMSSAIVCC